MKTIRDIFIIIGLLVLTGIAIIVSWFEDRIKEFFTMLKRDQYYQCPHGKIGNDPEFMLKTCEQCQKDLYESVDWETDPQDYIAIYRNMIEKHISNSNW